MTYVLDIYLENDKIDVEYDGGGHDLCVRVFKTKTMEEFINDERKRELKLLNKGIKTIRFITPHDLLPTDDEVKSLFNLAKQSLGFCNVVKIYLEENRIEFK